jgi:hypothetical protein
VVVWTGKTRTKLWLSSGSLG